MRAAPIRAIAVLAVALAACASRAPGPPAAPDLAAVRIGAAEPAAPAPRLPAGVPDDAVAVPLGATSVGTRFFAVTRVFEGEHIDYLGVGATGALAADGDWRLFGRGDPAFGAAVVAGGDGWTYTFGVRGDGGHHRAYVARFPGGSPAQRDRWEFLTADGRYSASVRDAAPVLGAGPGGLAIVAHPVDALPVAVFLRAAAGGGCELLARSAAPSAPRFTVWGPERRIAHLPDLAPPGRVAFDRAPRAVDGVHGVVDVPGAGRFRLVPSAQRP